MLAIICFNFICISDNSFCLEDVFVFFLRKISNFFWFLLFIFVVKLFRFVCGNNYGRSILYFDRIFDYGGDYRYGCFLFRKLFLTIILFFSVSYLLDLKSFFASFLRFVYRVLELFYGIFFYVFRKFYIFGRFF